MLSSRIPPLKASPRSSELMVQTLTATSRVRCLCMLSDHLLSRVPRTLAARRAGRQEYFGVHPITVAELVWAHGPGGTAPERDRARVGRAVASSTAGNGIDGTDCRRRLLRKR